MRKSKMLAKFRNDGFARVCGLGHYLPFFIRYAAHHNYDGIWLDLEHRAMDTREIQSILTMCHHNNIDCMVRPPTQERTKLYRYLEDGATGFLMPLISDAQMASDIVQAVKFPPLGNRGLDGAGRDADFGLGSWGPECNFTEDANRETFLITQIETLQAVEAAEEIASVEGVDGLFIGPGDLSLRIQNGPTGHNITLEKAIDAVSKAAQKHNKFWCITAGSIDEIKRYRQMGAQMVPWGGDFALMNVLKNCSEQLNEVPGA